MKLILEKWNKFLLTEANDMIKAGQNLVIFADWAKGHIEDSHKQPGKGSVFADFDLNLINNAVQNLDLNPEQVVYTLSVPNVGYDLVLPMEEARRLPDAEEVEVTKQDRGGDVTVTGIVTSKPMQDFLQDKMSVVIRQTTLDYVPEDLKENPEIVSGVKEGRVYSILSAWPGRGDVPPASQWGSDWAVVIPE